MKTGHIKSYLIFGPILLLSMCCPDFAGAEKIYYKNGRMLQAPIIKRDGDVIWFEHQLGNMGINMESIEKIENDDGTVSRYDYYSLKKKAYSLVSGKKYGEAIEVYNILLGSLPDSAELHYIRGALYHKMQDPVNAGKDYKILIDSSQADGNVFNNLGVIYINRKMYVDAVDLFRNAVRLSPKMPQAHDNLAQVLLLLSDYDGAIKEYDERIKLDNKDTDALYNKGVALLRKGDVKGARAHFQKVLSIDPVNRMAKNAVSWLDEFGK